MSIYQALDDCWNRIGVQGNQSCQRLDEVIHCRNCPVYADAADSILHRVVPDDYAKSWAEMVALPVAVSIDANLSTLVFRVGREWLGLPTAYCIHVTDQTSVHQLPHRRDPVLMGVVNVQGKLTAQVSFHALLTIDKHKIEGDQGHHIYPRLMILKFSGQTIAVPVDEVSGIVHYRPTDLKPAPSNVGKAMSRYITNVLTLDVLQIGCLDGELLGYNALQALR
jgi:chemotaxis-related protein WspD